MPKYVKFVRNIRGFTIIELVMIMTIIGALASIVLLTYPSGAERARDIQRKNDLNQYKAALERYALKNEGRYPVQASTATITNVCGVLGLGSLGDKSCPEDPGDGTYNYQTNTDGTQYALYTDLEDDETTDDWMVCSTGETGGAAYEPTNGECTVDQATPTPTSPATPTPTPIPTNTPTPTPTPLIVVHTGSDTFADCNAVCASAGRSCVSIGTNASATNSQAKRGPSPSCPEFTTFCGSSLLAEGVNCFDSVDGTYYEARWTRCRCE